MHLPMPMTAAVKNLDSFSEKKTGSLMADQVKWIELRLGASYKTGFKTWPSPVLLPGFCGKLWVTF